MLLLPTLCPHWNSPGKNTEVGSPSSGALPHREIKPEFPALQADSLPSEAPGKPLWALCSFNLVALFKKKNAKFYTKVNIQLE